MNKLTYQTHPRVTLATNQFVNVPIILQFDDTPLISIVKKEQLGFTTEIPIYHADGTYLAKVRGTRIYPTEDGKKAGLEMRSLENITVCEMNGQTLFEIFHESGDAFRMHAELYAPNGWFVKSHDAPIPDVISASGEMLQIGGIRMSDTVISGCRIGIWLKSDGSCGIAYN